MPNSRDIVIIGGGHNGLITAFYLAKGGFKPLVIERRNQIGGAAITEEFYPGFRSSVLAHSAGPLRPEVVRDMELEKHGLRVITPEVAVTAFSPDGRALILYRDVERAAQEIAKFSEADAAKYREFQPAIEKASRVIARSLAQTPPEIERPTAADLFGLLQLGRSLRGLGKANTYNLLRWAPMAVADLAAEFFETDLLRATIAARGIFGREQLLCCGRYRLYHSSNGRSRSASWSRGSDWRRSYRNQNQERSRTGRRAFHWRRTSCTSGSLECRSQENIS